MPETSSNSGDRPDSKAEALDSSSSSASSGSDSSSKKADAELTCFRPIELEGHETMCGTPYRYAAEHGCPFPNLQVEGKCNFAPQDESLWVGPGHHIPEPMVQKDRRVHVNIEFNMFGNVEQMEQSIERLNRLLELNGYRNSFISLRT